MILVMLSSAICNTTEHNVSNNTFWFFGIGHGWACIAWAYSFGLDLSEDLIAPYWLLLVLARATHVASKDVISKSAHPLLHRSTQAPLLLATKPYSSSMIHELLLV